MRYPLLVTILCGTATAVLPTRARCQVATLCTNCSDLTTQLLQQVDEAKSLATEISQYTTQLRQYANMLQNTAALPAQIFSQVQSDLMQIRSLTNAASLLSGNAGGIMARLNTAGSYAGQASSLGTNLSSQYTLWQTTLGNANQTLGRTLGVQSGQEQNNTALQAAIQQHSQTAAGQMQVMQAGVEMGAMTNTQLQQIQTTLHAAAQSAATRDSIDFERTALADEISKQMSSATPFQIGGNPRY